MRLDLTHITKRFPGVLALDGARFDLRAGEVHALMGENGAGKSTLMKIVSGLFPPDAGEIRLDGSVVRFATPAEAKAAGIHTVFQELTILPNRTIVENLLIGREPTRAGGLWLDKAAMRGEAQAILDRLGIALDAGRLAATLSSGQRQMVEIARACAQNPRVLILDEPTSSLGRAEEELLFDLVRRLREDGVAIVYITHRMSEVFALSDRITVLRDGRFVMAAETAEVDRPALIRAMVGREVAEDRHGLDPDTLPVALEARGLSRGRAVRGADLTLHTGEVLGIAGLMGAGRTELARLIAGIDRPDAGEMRLFGEPYAPGDIRQALARGVAYVSEDRKGLGLVLPLSVADNIALPSLDTLATKGIVPPRRIVAFARDWMDRLGVKAASGSVAVETLSGGNQQKVALAKWLAIRPRVILLDEPTRGVDVGAKAEIYALIRQLTEDGTAILAISSELPELLQISDRIAVIAHGKVAGVVSAADATEERLLDLAFSEDQAA
ncbi:sugar ABC transporter ATP-binding protein [Aestuariibius sp. 2305UL40-4]|uniref:sugar ABC transporter ATP-binding protein n=1 Tax=Aestuariibius violaceus TaxID=3234132 RepID=UPI00345ED3D1